MSKNKITELPEGNGYIVNPNHGEVDRALCLIQNVLDNADITYADALTALCLCTVEAAHISKIKKPQLLMRISEWWEKFDSITSEDE